jgi:hypothetical protein
VRGVSQKDAGVCRRLPNIPSEHPLKGRTLLSHERVPSGLRIQPWSRFSS